MEEKQKYYDVMKAKLEEWDARFDLTRAKTKKKMAAVRMRDSGSEARELPDDLRNLRDRMRGKLDELRDAAEGSWLAIKDQIEDTWRELTDYSGRFRKSA